jgi:coenzyme F420-0:L-glutamate ligase/coenzyme F420-1:gamma-L-glutamate ligase
LLQVIRSRRSIRRFQQRPVPTAIVSRLLEAARWAPSAHNRQPWRYVVITDGVQRAALADAMGRSFRAALEEDGLPSEQVERQVLRSYERIGGAPVLIVLCLSMIDMDDYPDEKRRQAEYVMAVQSVALSAQNLLLAAHTEGLGACWMCAPLFCQDVVARALALPDDWEAQALITLGYPAEEPRREREPMESKTLWY